jgi:acrylyl-CoA reductase (NADPH)
VIRLTIEEAFVDPIESGHGASAPSKWGTVMPNFTAVRLFNEEGRRVSRVVTINVDELDPGDVVIRTRFAAVNFKDARAVSGEGNVIKRFPCIPGIEMSGVVASSSDARFREGDRVTVQGGAEFGIRHDGAYAEYVRVPAAWVHRVTADFDEFTTMALGIGAYTSSVAIERMMALGVTPQSGPIAVTGATGGCGSFAVDILAGLGFEVVAITGKASEADYLRSIGAARVIGRTEITSGPKPLEEQRWAGCIDTVGGAPLDAILRSLKKGGVVCAFGNAAGETFTTSIYPFILRSAMLIGINANHPVDERGTAWSRLATDMKPRHLDRIIQIVSFAQLKPYCDQLIKGGARGRAVVQFQ